MSEREYWRLIFPKWFVDWVMGPFPDEVGELVVALKHLSVVLITVALFDLAVPEAYDQSAAQGLVLAGMAMIAYGAWAPWE